MTDLERLGGLDGLRATMSAFVDRCFDDPIIGFLFEGASREIVAWHEFELAARQLGAADVPYTGRPLSAVHKPRRIHAGQFRRRLAILKATLRDRAVPDDLVERFLVHQERFRAAVTVDGDCVD